jgi:hypothetical protein
MSLLLAGALGGIGAGLSKQGEQQQAAETLYASEQRKAIMQAALDDRRDAREDAKLKSAEAVADKRYAFEDKRLAQQAELADKRFGLLLEGLKLKANKPSATAEDKQAATDSKLEMAALESGMTVPEMKGLLATARAGQFMDEQTASDAMAASPDGVLSPNSYRDFLARNKEAIDRGATALAGGTATDIRRIGEAGKQSSSTTAPSDNSAEIKILKEKKALWADKANPAKNHDFVSRQEAQKKIAQYDDELMQLIDPPKPILLPDDAAKALGLGDGVLPRGN